jgi:BirA family biotin operon repressor/biotin-[acetyl-CoA-carboxylase] ligase
MSPFDLSAVRTAVAGTQFAGHLHHLATIPSTNSLALAVAHSGARHGVWIADQQTAGRGRGSHAWHSAAGAGLYMSVLIAPPITAESAQRLSFLSAIAVQSAIATTFGLKVRDQIDIRWPNDLMLARPAALGSLSPPQRKCGGILIETSAQPAASPAHTSTLRFAVIGIGVNLNHTAFPPELDAIATSIRRELSVPALPDATQPLPREPLAAAILLALDRELCALVNDSQPSAQLTSNLEPRTSNLSRDLTQFSSWLSGKQVRVEMRSPSTRNSASSATSDSYTGTTIGLDPQGFLRVNADDGTTRTVLSGGLREI